MQYYQNSVPRALISLFPNLALEESKFIKRKLINILTL